MLPKSRQAQSARHGSTTVDVWLKTFCARMCKRAQPPRPLSAASVGVPSSHGGGEPPLHPRALLQRLLAVTPVHPGARSTRQPPGLTWRMGTASGPHGPPPGLEPELHPEPSAQQASPVRGASAPGAGSHSQETSGHRAGHQAGTHGGLGPLRSEGFDSPARTTTASGTSPTENVMGSGFGSHPAAAAAGPRAYPTPRGL